MSSSSADASLLLDDDRPEFILAETPQTYGVVEKPLGVWERISANSAIRKTFVLILLAAAWEIYARRLNDPLLFPTLTATVQALIAGILSGVIPARMWSTIKVLLQGYTAGLLLAALLTVAASASRLGKDLLQTMTAMFNPLPAIALLPLALIWFGLGSGSLIFVLMHSVLWAVALNMHTGFQSVSPTLRMVGSNYGLSWAGYATKILIPAATPNILAGLKIGWAFAWRTLIAAELVFGVSSGAGGLGWYLYENKNDLEIANVFAGLLTVIIIGLVVENLVFRKIEERTVRKWGMQG